MFIQAYVHACVRACCRVRMCESKYAYCCISDTAVVHMLVYTCTWTVGLDAIFFLAAYHRTRTVIIVNVVEPFPTDAQHSIAAHTRDNSDDAVPLAGITELRLREKVVEEKTLTQQQWQNYSFGENPLASKGLATAGMKC